MVRTQAGEVWSPWNALKLRNHPLQRRGTQASHSPQASAWGLVAVEKRLTVSTVFRMHANGMLFEVILETVKTVSETLRVR